MLERSFVLGVDHHVANVDIRQCLSQISLEDLSSQLPLDELYVLSTCNRFEVYGVAPCSYSSTNVRNHLKKIFSEKSGCAVENLVYEKTGEDVVRHGFNVASSLESMVLGEPQILGQMKQAYSQAKEKGKIGTGLDKLLNATFHVGKRVRHETLLSQESVSVASAAVKMAKNVYEGGFIDANVLVVGAGEMCTAAARHLKTQGVKNTSVLNRTLARAYQLAEEIGGVALPFSRLDKALIDCDIAFVCIDVNKPVITAELIKNVMQERKGRPLTLVDIAVPCNVEELVLNVEGVRLYNMDTLSSFIEQSKDKRYSQVEKAQKIIEEEVAAFQRLSDERKNSHIVNHLRQSFESVRQEVLQNYPSKEAEVATRLLLNKILHQPTVMIKSGFVPAEGVEMLLDMMFNLRCPRVKFLQTDSNSANKDECPFLETVRQEGIGKPKH